MPSLPRRHIRIGAALVFFVGLFFAGMTFLGAEFQLRPHGERYATAELIDWLTEVIGRPAAAVVLVAMGAVGAWAILRFVPESDG